MNSLVKLLQKEAFKTNKLGKAASGSENQKINSMMQNLRNGISKETLEKIKKANLILYKINYNYNRFKK